MKDYYQLLGVNKEASASEIKSAYRKLSKKFHPDVNDGDAFFEERFKEIQEAYENLSTPDRKAAYDDKNAFSNKPGEERKSQATTEHQPSGRTSQKTDTNDIHTKNTTSTPSKSRVKFWGIVIFILIGGFLHALFKSINKSSTTTFATPIQNYAHADTTSISTIPNATKEAQTLKLRSPSDNLTGTWTGVAYQSDVNENWTIRLNCKGQKYTIKYPSLGCGGSWRLIDNISGKWTFEEQLDYGKSNCNNGGTIVIEIMNGKKLKFSYYYPNYYTLNAEGFLYRTH